MIAAGTFSPADHSINVSGLIYNVSSLGLAPGTYHWRVKGNESTDFCTPFQFTIVDIQAPTGNNANVTACSLTNNVDISWTKDANATTEILEIYDNLTCSGSPTTTVNPASSPHTMTAANWGLLL